MTTKTIQKAHFMLKHSILSVFSILFTLFSFSQDIEIKQAKNPYNKTLQWGNKGTFLIAEDPRNVTFKRTLHFITAEGEASWQKEFLPKVKNPIPVFNDQSKYIYFFDKVTGLDQMITFTQFGPSGVSTPKAIKFRTILRTQLGSWINSSLFHLEQIVTLEDDLVFVFSYPNEKKNEVMYAVMRLDHNSLAPKCVFAPESNSYDHIKDGLAGHLMCIGSLNKQIYFSKNIMKKDQKSNQVFYLGKKNNWSQKYLKYVPSYFPFPSNSRLAQYGTINNYKSGLNSKKKLDFRSNSNNVIFHNGKIINYAFTSKDAKTRESVRVFVQDMSGNIIWDKNILFSEFIDDDFLKAKGKPEQLFLDGFVADKQLEIVIKGKKEFGFSMDLSNGAFKKRDIELGQEDFIKNPYQLIHGKLSQSENKLEIVLNNGIYSLNPNQIEKGHLLLKKN